MPIPSKMALRINCSCPEQRSSPFGFHQSRPSGSLLQLQMIRLKEKKMLLNHKIGQDKTCFTFSDHVGNASLKEVCHYTFYFKDLNLQSIKFKTMEIKFVQYCSRKKVVSLLLELSKTDFKWTAKFKKRFLLEAPFQWCWTWSVSTGPPPPCRGNDNQQQLI